MHPFQRPAYRIDRRSAAAQPTIPQESMSQMQEQLQKLPGIPAASTKSGGAAIFSNPVRKPEVVDSKSVQLPQDNGFVFVKYDQLSDDTISLLEKLLTGASIDKPFVEDVLKRHRQSKKNFELKKALRFGVTQEAVETVSMVVNSAQPEPVKPSGNVTMTRVDAQPNVVMRNVKHIVAQPEAKDGMYTVELECGHMILSRNTHEAHCKTCASQIRKPFSRYSN